MERIEDDPEICEVITEYFAGRGTRVDAVQSGGEAELLIVQGLDAYALVLLDVMLPGVDGFTLCRKIRRRSEIPVIFITARGREEDILYGFDLGCDDYVVKPVLLSALHARCTALVRRAQGCVRDTVLTCGRIRLDVRRLTCEADGREIELAPKEFAVLRYLLEHKGWAVSREALLTRIWGTDYFGSDRVVDNHIRKLRAALGSAGGQIRTVVGRGYRLSEE